MSPRPVPSAPDTGRYRTIAAMLRDHAEARGDKPFIVAVDQGGRSITFRQLWKLSNRMARFLADRKIGPGGRVAVLTDNRLEMPLLYYAIQRYGAAFCTINIEVNAANARQMLARMEPALVLCQEDLDADAFGRDETREWISFGDCDPDGGAARDGGLFELLTGYDDGDDAPDAAAGPEDLCVLSFTSGTSAAPKGVMHRFGNYFWIADQTIDMWKLTDADRMLEFRSLSWASSHMLCLSPALRVGATILLANRFSRSRFFDWLRDYQPTMVIGVPTVINMLLEHEPTPDDVAATRRLRFMSSSTAPLMVEQHKRFEDTYGIELVQLYGMSEGGIVASNHVGERRIGSVGPSGLYQNLRIVGPDGESLATGDVGEIELGGAQPAGGYLHADGTVEEIGRLKTGDLGYLDDDGFLMITGRAKDVIIRGGVNIAPLEIDNALSAHPDIREAATIGVADRVYGERPVSFVALRREATATEADLLAHCATALAEFKMPSEVILLDDIPKNDRGKVDRAELARIWENSYSSS
ncbi:MAG: class I adenylate-forming enzyme family protein [Alphaproteobacteria bacterium]